MNGQIIIGQCRYLLSHIKYIPRLVCTQPFLSQYVQRALQKRGLFIIASTDLSILTMPISCIQKQKKLRTSGVEIEHKGWHERKPEPVPKRYREDITSSSVHSQNSNWRDLVRGKGTYAWSINKLVSSSTFQRGMQKKWQNWLYRSDAEGS